MISFICSSKYSSSILGAEKGQGRLGKALLSEQAWLSLFVLRIHLLYFMMVSVILPFHQDSLRIIIVPHLHYVSLVVAQLNTSQRSHTSPQIVQPQ